MNIFEKLPKIYPITTQEQIDRLVIAAAKDGHKVSYPTHIVMKHEEIVGYFSICKIPVIGLWLHTQEIRPIDSVILLNTAENFARAAGHKHIFVPVSPDSPYVSVLERHMEMKQLYQATVWGKEL